MGSNGYPAEGDAPLGHEAYCEDAGLISGELASHCQPDTQEAPWPRFHPLPTRPVLGSGPVSN